MIYIPEISSKNLEAIYFKILVGFLSDSSVFKELEKYIKSIVESSIIVLHKV